MIHGSRPTLRDLPLPAKLVLSVFLMALGLGYISAMMQLHFKSGSRDGNPLPTVKDVVRRYAGSDWPPNGNGKVADKPAPANGKKDAEKQAADKKDEAKQIDAKINEVVAKKELPAIKDGQVAGIKIKSLIDARCVGCHNPDLSEKDLLLHNFEKLAESLKPEPAKSKIHRVITGPADVWSEKSMVQAFTKKGDDWKDLIKERPEAEVRKERETERLAFIAWLLAGAKKAHYDADAFPLPDDLATVPLTEELRVRIDPNGNAVERPLEKEASKKDPLPPNKNLEKKAVMPGNQLAVNGPIKVKIQTLINIRCAGCHKEEKKEVPLDNYADLERVLVQEPNDKFGKIHRVVTGPANRWGKDSMVPAFFNRSDGWKDLLKTRPENDVRAERENEKEALITWIEAGAPKEAYEENEFIVPAGKTRGAFTKEMLVGNPDPVRPLPELRQIDFDSLVQSTHAHMLTFALLWCATGLIFAFTSYPLWMRIAIAPTVLLAQVADVLCWWLARLPDVGPYFAVAILGTGAIVGLGLTLQIVLGLFNMYGSKGKMALLFICLFGVAGLGTVFIKYVEPELAVEKKEAVAPKQP